MIKLFKRIFHSRNKIKLQLVWRIITGQYKHFAFIVLDDEQFVNAVSKTVLHQGEIRSLKFGYFGVAEVQAFEMIRTANAQIDDDAYLISELENKINLNEHLGKDYQV